MVFLPPLALTILFSPFPLDSLRSTKCLAMVLCIYFHQLLGEQLMTTGLVNDLQTQLTIIRNISLNFLSVMFGFILVLWVIPFQVVTREHSLPWYGSQDGPVIGWSLAQISMPPLPGQNIL